MKLPRWLLRFGFHLLYNELAWTYDWVSRAVSLGQWRHWQRAIIPRLSGQRVLEIAFGTGDLLVDMTAVGYRPCGLDLSPYMVGIAKAKLARKGMATPLCQGRVQALPFANGVFDSVAITFPTDFICQPSALAEISRVLALSGRLVVIDEGYLLDCGLLGRFINWLYVFTGQRESRPELKALLKRSGFAITQGEYSNRVSTAHIMIATRSAIAPQELHRYRPSTHSGQATVMDVAGGG
jgi:ubiquinone/menaquinone biosynthesis C-methylase UbiE